VKAGDAAVAAVSSARLASAEPTGAARPPWACSASGCPLPGALSTGGAERQCFLHFGLGAAHAGRVSGWLRDNPAIVAALRVHDGATPTQMEAIGERLRQAGLADWAPRVVVLDRPGYGRHGEGLRVERSEIDSPKLYRYRLRALVDAQISLMLRPRDQPS
jgi:hypothetical protein